MSSHLAIGEMDRTRQAGKDSPHNAGVLKTSDQETSVTYFTEILHPYGTEKRVAKWYVAGLAIATLLTTGGLLIAKFACHQDIDLTGKTFWIAAGTSLGGAILLPLVVGGAIVCYKIQKKQKKADEASKARFEKTLTQNLSAMDDPRNIFESPSTAAKNAAARSKERAIAQTKAKNKPRFLRS